MGNDMGFEKINIKELLESGDTVVVCDTNVYLHIYTLAQGYCDFAMDCMNTIKKYLIMPSIIEIEFNDHRKKGYRQVENKLQNAEDEVNETLKRARQAILSTCTRLRKLQFPDADKLLKDLDVKIEEQLDIIKEFFDKRKATLNLVSERWEKKDFVADLIKDLKENGQILEGFSESELYRLCENGKKRYRRLIPPGYEDANKDGIKKYGDYIWWSQICQYAKKEKKNIILVTDDVKKDWWDKKEDGNIELREELFKEFHKTNQEIYPFISKDFYEEISKEYDIEKSDVVQVALEITDEEYCERIADEVIYYVEADLIDYGIEDIDDEDSHIGEIKDDEFKLESWTYLSGDQTEKDENEVSYILTYEVEFSGNSYIESETKGENRRKKIHHVFSGEMEIEVFRLADIVLDFENECDFEHARVIGGYLEEIEYKVVEDVE